MMTFTGVLKRLFGCTSVLALCASGVLVASAESAAAQDLCSGALISGACTGPFDWSSGDLSVASTGDIAGSPDGILVYDTATVGTLINAGTVTGIGADGAGIDNYGRIDVLINDGISRGTGSNADGLDNLGFIGTLLNNGTIVGTSVMDGVGCGVGIWNVGTIASLTNNGVINGSEGSGTLDAGIFNNGSIGTLTNTNAISGSGGTNGIGVDNDGFIAALINSGVIAGGNGDSSSGTLDTGIDNDGTILSLLNTGTITGSGSSNGIGIDNAIFIGTLINRGIVSGGSSVDDLGIANYGTLQTLINDGTIYGSSAAITGSHGAGIANWGTIGTLINNGDVDGGGSSRGAGLYNGGSIAAVINTGTIDGGHGAGIFNGGTIASLTNSGILGGTVSSSSISSDRGAGINNFGGVIGTLTNSGTLLGNQYAIYSSGSIGLIVNSGVIAGNIVSTAKGVVFAGGSDGRVGTLTGSATGQMGTIAAPSVTFLSGTQVLDDALVVAGGAGTVTNSASLQLYRTVSIQGNYVQNSAGALVIEVTSASAYGALTVSGAAALDNGQLTLAAAQGAALATGTYTVVSAGTLSASNVTVQSVLPETTAIQDNAVVVTLSSWTQAGKRVGAGTAAVGVALDGLTSRSAYTSLLTRLSSLSSAQQGRALKQLNVTQVAALTSANAALAISAIDQRQTVLDKGRAEPSSVAVWGHFLGGYSTQDTTADGEGYAASSFGLIAGVDASLADDWIGGATVSWLRDDARGKADASGNKAQIDSYQMSVYGAWRPDGGPLHVEGLLGVANHQYDQKRALDFLDDTAVARYQGWQYHAKFGAGYDIAIDDLTLTPLASVLAMRFENNAYVERNAGLANLAVAAQGFNAVESALGARLAMAFDVGLGRLCGDVQATWTHSYTDSPLAVTAALGGQNFVSTAARPAADGAQVALGVTWLRSDSLSLRVEYDGEIRSDYSSHFGMLKLRNTF